MQDPNANFRAPVPRHGVCHKAHQAVGPSVLPSVEYGELDHLAILALEGALILASGGEGSEERGDGLRRVAVLLGELERIDLVLAFHLGGRWVGGQDPRHGLCGVLVEQRKLKRELAVPDQQV